MNLLTSKPASDIALAAPTSARPDADARALARAGARRHQPVADLCPARRDSGASAAEVETLVADANAAFPALSLTRPTSRSCTAASSQPSRDEAASRNC